MAKGPPDGNSCSYHSGTPGVNKYYCVSDSLMPAGLVAANDWQSALRKGSAVAIEGSGSWRVRDGGEGAIPQGDRTSCRYM
jgi:hypothetical protein